MKELPGKIVVAIRKAISREVACLHDPTFGGREAEYLEDCIKSTFVSSVGEYVTRFERMLADFVGVERAVAVVNGTAALQVALQMAGVGKGDEVFTSPLTFVATANAMSYLGSKPHFVDCNERNLGLDAESLQRRLAHVAEKSGDFYRNKETGARLSAVVPMHTFGHPCEMSDIMLVAKKYNLAVVEDAAESLGSSYRGKQTGGFGVISATSFNGNKIITTGGGGAILTNDRLLADRAKFLTTTAKRPHKWEYVHDEIGYNFRMPNLNAAVGCAQLEKLDELLVSKRRLADRYAKVFLEVPYCKLFTAPTGCESNYWLQTLLLDEEIAFMRDDILRETNEVGIQTRPSWTLLHRLKPYQDCPRGALDVAQSLERRIINIPSGAGLA